MNDYKEAINALEEYMHFCFRNTSDYEYRLTIKEIIGDAIYVSVEVRSAQSGKHYCITTRVLNGRVHILTASGYKLTKSDEEGKTLFLSAVFFSEVDDE